MLPVHRTVSIAPAWSSGGETVLASWADANRLLREGWESLSAGEALRQFDRIDRRMVSPLRGFIADSHLERRDLRDLGGNDILDIIRTCIRRGEVVVLRPSRCKTPSESQELRRLAAQIERQARGRLTHRGRQYKLVLGDDLARIRDRDSYEVVPQTEARAILEQISRETAGLGDALATAHQKLSKDWRPPSHPEGLVLLRRMPIRASESRDDSPAITPSGMKALLDKARLEIHVVDLAGNPQEGLAYRIEMPDGGSAQGELDKDGRATAKSSLPGVFTVAFPDLDGADWDGDGALDLPPEEERGEASKHEVKQGDRLPTIARATGFARWQTIWDFAANTTLRELRGNPYVLLQGDQVAIPSKVARVAEVEGGTAEYVVQTAPETLRVRFAETQATEDEPVMFRAVPDAGTEMFEGQLADDGTMEIDLPPDTAKVTVELYCGDGDDPFVTYEFDVGHLDPCSEATGIQMRLANLGYYDGEIDGDVGKVTRSAIRRFRSEYGLPLGDDIDDDLRSALAWVHDDDDDTDECEADQTTSAEVAEDDGGDVAEGGEADGLVDDEEDPDVGASTPDGAEEQLVTESDEEEPEEWPAEAWGREPLEQEGGDADAVEPLSEDADGDSREEPT